MSSIPQYKRKEKQGTWTWREASVTSPTGAAVSCSFFTAAAIQAWSCDQQIKTVYVDTWPVTKQLRYSSPSNGWTKGGWGLEGWVSVAPCPRSRLESLGLYYQQHRQ